MTAPDPRDAAPAGAAPRAGNAAGAGGEARVFRTEAADLLAAISAVHRTTRRAVRHAWASEPLPTTQSELLRLVAGRPGICVAEAARELRLAPNTVSTLVGRLAEQGLLSRERSRPDGRSVRLTATDGGQRRIAQWRDMRAELASGALAALAPADRAALTPAIPALIRLAETMEAQ